MAEVGALRVSLSLDSANFKSGIQDINRRLKAVDSEFKLAASSSNLFNGSMDGLRTRADNLSRKLQLQRAKAEELRTRIRAVKPVPRRENAAATVRMLTDYNNAQAAMQRTLSRLAEVNTQIQRNSTVTGRLQNSMRNMSESFNHIGERMKSTGQEIATTFGVAFAGIGGALGLTVKKAMDFEAQMSSVKSVMDPADAKKYGKSLEDLATTMGAKTKYSAQEAAVGIEELVKAGISVKDVMGGGLEGALSLATAGELSLGDAAEIASTALNAFKSDGLTVGKAADILAGAANASATSVSEMKLSLSAVSAVASGMGVSFKDTNTALAVLAQNSLKGSDAGTSLKTMLLNLSPHTKQAADMMDALNLGTTNAVAGFNFLAQKGIAPVNKTTDAVSNSLMQLAKQQAGAGASASKIAKEYDTLAKQSGFASSAFYDANGNLKSMSDIAGILQNALKGLNSEQRQNALQTMFGTDAIRAGNILYKEGAKGLNDMANAMGKIKASDVAAEKMNNLKGKIEGLKGSIDTAMMAFGKSLIPLISILTVGLQNLVNSFNQLSPGMKSFIAIGSFVVASLLGITAAIGGMAMLIGGALEGLGAFGTFLLGTAESAGVLSAAITFITGPVGIAIAAIAGLIAIFVALYKNNEAFRNKVQEIWGSIKNAFQVSLTFISEYSSFCYDFGNVIHRWTVR
jgi:TP901 family phage tail tape measure protein